MNNIRFLRKFQPVISTKRIIPTNKRVLGMMNSNMANQNKSIETVNLSKEDLQKLTELIEKNSKEIMDDIQRINLGIKFHLVIVQISILGCIAF